MSIDLSKCTLEEYLELRAKMGDSTQLTDNQSQPESTASPVVEIKLTEAKEQWTRDMLENDDLSLSTRTKYEEHIRLWTAYNGNVPVSSIRTSNIVEYKEHLKTERGLRNSSINVILVGISQFLNYCKDSGYIKINPAKKVKKLTAVKQPPKSLDESTINTMRNAIKNWCEAKGKFEHLMMYDVMRLAGLRVGEVVCLKFHDVVYSTDSDGNECAGLVIERGKGDKERFVWMPDELFKSYKNYSANLNRSKNPNNFIFAHHGEKYTTNAVRTHHLRICRTLPFHVSPHMLRHSFATKRINSGAKMSDLQDDMGHSNFATTSIYIRPSREDKREARNI